MTITAVGSAYTVGAPAGGGTATVSVSPTAIGNVLVVAAACAKTADGEALFTISGGGVTTWNLLVRTGDADIWWGVVTATGAHTFSAYVAYYGGIIIQEFSGGGAGTWSADSVTKIGTTPTSTVFSSGSVTPTGAGELAIASSGAFINGGATAVASPAGFNAIVCPTTVGNTPLMVWGITAGGALTMGESPHTATNGTRGFAVGFLIFTSSAVPANPVVMIV